MDAACTGASDSKQTVGVSAFATLRRSHRVLFRYYDNGNLSLGPYVARPKTLHPEGFSLPFLGRVVAIAAALLAAAHSLLATDAQMQPAPTADLACPPVGTVFTMSMPLAVSAVPVFRNRVSVIGTDGPACHISSEALGVYWMHAGMVNRTDQAELRVAAESLWPLRVGNTAHANVQYDGQHYIVRFKVAAYEKFKARVGTYDAFKIIKTFEADGHFISEETRWWAPALRYTLSFRRDSDNYSFEIATIDSHAP